jgi:hypothetical protein
MAEKMVNAAVKSSGRSGGLPNGDLSHLTTPKADEGKIMSTKKGSEKLMK